MSFLMDAGVGGTGGGARFRVSRLTTCPKAFLIEIFLGTKGPALALSDVE